ncbi:MAG: hypothetical protein A2Z95_06300 [Gallionellales bacterium GWA2_60_18]|nr:MAG: hypothetical protein A2Z95_06300 [Gallionellales bacterium GWA2_60_18]
MKWLKRSLLGLSALLALGLAAAYLAPLDSYVPELERMLGGQLHEPVRIGHLRFSALPLPHLELHDVRLGGDEGISARTVDVAPDLQRLLAGEVAVGRIVVKDGSAHLTEVRKLVGLLVEDSGELQGMAVRELQFSGMSLVAPGMTLAPIEGRLEFTHAGQLKVAWFAMNQQTASLTVLPQPDRSFALVVQAKGWSLPALPQLPLDELSLVGVLGARELAVQSFSAASRGMRVAGSGKLDFSDGWRVQATLNRMEVPLEQLMSLTGRQVDLSGALSAQGTLETEAGSPELLKDNFRFAGDVQARRVRARIDADFRYPLVIDEIRARVTVQPQRLELKGLNAKLYGGRLTGAVNVGRKDATLRGDIAASGIAMQRLVGAFSDKVSFSGNMESTAKFTMRLDDFGRFPANLQLNGSFHVRDGVLGKVDLAQAAGSPGKVAADGGSTRFDDLTGLLSVDTAGYHFRKIKIVSGVLHAKGSMDISPASRLGGTLDVDIKGTGWLASMPMVISGTLDEPVIGLNKSAMAGAAVGTAILGPGLGTAVGAKVGGFLNKLFGGGSDKTGGKDAVPAQPAKQ